MSRCWFHRWTVIEYGQGNDPVNTLECLRCGKVVYQWVPM